MHIKYDLIYGPIKKRIILTAFAFREGGGAGKSSVNEKLYGNERKQIESGEEEANELKRILRLKEPESETERLWQDLVQRKRGGFERYRPSE